ncbi:MULTISPECIES: phage tail protein [unclassified Pseudomonas]|uniref:phage tail protein n=1 Tax=unclassified Pseudomonas TaxID=196821 RepID=UPI0035C25B64
MVDQNSQFYAILTNVGAAKQANADALGIPWRITQMGVGDANGADPTPNANQTSLINEWRRAPLNQLKVDERNSAIIVAEQVIPADVGGRWIREIALYDADDDMVAVANCAPTYKPLLSQGSGRTQVVRMNLVVSSASNVQLKIDPAVVLATREWVTEELAKQDFKHSVLAATTAPIALSGLQTIDGIALVIGARVLVKNQAAPKDNGLYSVASGAWTRCGDADSDSKVTPGLLVLVEKGTANGDSAWQLVTDEPVTLGVTAQQYEMAFGRSGVAAGTYRSVTVDKYGRVIAASSPTTIAGYGLTDVYSIAQLDSKLELKAPIASPIFTGNPSGPTPPRGNISTQLATTQFVKEVGWTLPSSLAGIPSGSTLTLEQVGRLTYMSGVGTWSSTVVLPSVGIPVGSIFCISVGSGDGTIVVHKPAVSGGYIAIGSTSYTTLTVKANEPPLILVYNGDGIYAVLAGGLSNTQNYASLKSLNGWSKIPNGMIEQWGRITIPANVSSFNIDTVFPLVFPNACFSVVASVGVSTGDYAVSSYRQNRQSVSIGVPSLVGFDGQVFCDNNLFDSREVQWRAIGY